MEYQLYKNIVSNPDICNGRPTIKGTRITVQSVMGFINAGNKIGKVLKGYQRMTEEDLLTCKEFNARFLKKASLSNLLRPDE
jgi:uncharacterized protein (DUF433 family)